MCYGKAVMQTDRLIQMSDTGIVLFDRDVLQMKMLVSSGCWMNTHGSLTGGLVNKDRGLIWMFCQ
jgi:hypothetical protein